MAGRWGLLRYTAVCSIPHYVETLTLSILATAHSEAPASVEVTAPSYNPCSSLSPVCSLCFQRSSVLKEPNSQTPCLLGQ